ncbi:MAG: alpha-glucan family phosphorylase [Patescibacteria group bacterium]|nr:alpha-glucan family phosphorylase [Patescibacteria group bacterium]
MHSAPIAYFCAEYGLDEKIPIYAGGLGVLAGDTIKAAAETNLPFVGIGLLYRGKKAQQKITPKGHQVEEDINFDPTEVGLEHVYHQGQPLFIKMYLKDRYVWVRVWKKQLTTQVILYLLDTDTEQNEKRDRDINDALYFGDKEKQLQQQFILGIGGAKLIAKLRLKPRVYHLNEGRPGFMIWQLLRQVIQQQDLDYYQAVHQVKNKLVYTNHTLVPAGNIILNLDEVIGYARFYAKDLKISVDELLAPGLSRHRQGFSMTDYAMKMSHTQSGVSELHTSLSRKIWPDYDWQNVTNGIHLKTWQDQRFRKKDISDEEIWQIHLDNKQKLQKFVKARTGFEFDEKRLVIGWARRLAGYKRLDAVFSNITRLADIAKRKGQEIQLLVAGKAHQEDEAGKEMLHQVLKYMSDQMAGYALFVPDYNLEVARYLVKGCDVWLNIPEKGKEACGTSGMKAISNGVLLCTTSDGWANEVDLTEMGWVLPSENVGNQFYQTLSEKIQPLFYNQDSGKVNHKWVEKMKKSMTLAENFSAKRMLQEYQEKLY